MIEGLKIPKVTFRTRIGDEVETDGGCAIGGQWLNKTTDDFFKGKRVVVFSLPGAFTPTCSSQQLPGFEENYEKIKGMDVDEVYCVSVNDSYVMNAWANHMKINSVKIQLNLIIFLILKKEESKVRNGTKNMFLQERMKLSRIHSKMKY